MLMLNLYKVDDIKDGGGGGGLYCVEHRSYVIQLNSWLFFMFKQ